MNSSAGNEEERVEMPTPTADIDYDFLDAALLDRPSSEDAADIISSEDEEDDREEGANVSSHANDFSLVKVFDYAIS